VITVQLVPQFASDSVDVTPAISSHYFVAQLYRTTEYATAHVAAPTNRVNKHGFFVPLFPQTVCMDYEIVLVLFFFELLAYIYAFTVQWSLLQETQLSLRDRATRACQLKSGKVLHKCRRLVFEKV